MDILHNGQILPDATPTGGPGVTALNLVDGVGITWNATRVAGRVGLTAGWRSGTSFPGSPSDGDLFYRTDRRIIYEYNASVSRWLSLDRKYVQMGPASVLPGNLGANAVIAYSPIFEDVYLESWAMSTLVLTTNNASNFWTFTLFRDFGVSTATIGSQDTHLDTHDTWSSHVLAINSIIAATNQMFEVDAVFTGGAGNVFSSHMLVLRSAG